jgi:hypothetical protein
MSKIVLQHNPRWSGLDETVALGPFLTQSGHATINFAVVHKALSHLVW